jgi:CubicO group peptidase (beta-lactamase class C family)
VVQLVAEGLVDLDSPIQDYLPDFRVADPEASTKITVRDLLVQTSGFSTRQGWGLIERSEQRSLDSEVRDLADATLAHPPGEQFEYSNRNFQVAGLVVEAVSGQSYAGYMREHVFGPLGMDHTFATHASAIRGGLADGYRAWFGVPISHAATIIEGVVPAAGIASSASDMARWLVANLTGDRRVLPRASFDELHAPAVPFDRGQDSLSDGDEFYAMGWIVAQDRGEPSTIRYEHGGTAPQYSLGMQIRPEPGWGVAVLVNDQASLAMPGTSLTDGVMDLLLGEPRAGVARDFTARYLLLDLFAVLIVSLLVRSVTGLRGWRNRFARRRIRAGVWGAFLHLVVPVAIIVGVPWVTGSWWRLIATYGPDLTLVLWATSLTLLGVGVAKVVLHVTRRRGDEQAVTAAG